MLPHRIWTVITDELLVKTSDLGCKTPDYADDLAISLVGWHEQTLAECIEKDLSITHKWCQDKGPHINPEKTFLVPFSEKGKLTLDNVHLQDMVLEYSNQVKYVRIYFDRRLTWNPHARRQAEKSITALFAGQFLYGNPWGIIGSVRTPTAKS